MYILFVEHLRLIVPMIRARALMQEDAPELVPVLAFFRVSLLVLLACIFSTDESVHVNKCREQDSLLRLLALHRREVVDKAEQREM